MRVLASLVAVIGTAILAASATGLVSAAALPPYDYNDGQSFEIQSNRDWHGVAGTAGVREVAPYSRLSTSGTDRKYTIWTPSCKPGQKFSVARTVDMLGPPTQVDFSFEGTLGIASTVVFVNGKPLARSVGNNSPSYTQDPAQMKLFREGSNELMVVVTLPTTPDPCNFPGTKPSLWFAISGDFGTDLSVGAPATTQKLEYFKADSGRTVTTHIHVTNNGPDEIPDATMTVSMGGRGFCTNENPDGSCMNDSDYQFTMVSTEMLGGIHCTTTGFAKATCPITNMKAGQTLFVTVIMRYQVDPAYPSWTEEDMPLSWQAQMDQGSYGPTDLNSANNSGSVGYVFCSTRSTMAGCQTAQ